MIELRNISAGYGGSLVLHDISLKFRDSEVTALVGPNGCGKSTLLRVAARLMPPNSGEVFVGDRDERTMTSKEFARHVALLPQSRATPEISVGALVLHGRFPYLGYPRRYSAKDRQAAKWAMEMTGVAELAQDSVSNLSGGQRQKVYLAMAVAQDTPTLLLDEPTTFLDIAHQLELIRLARVLARQGKAVVVVLHDLNLALTCADRVVVMDKGAVEQDGTPEEVYRSGVLERVFGVLVRRVELEGQRQYLFFEK